MSDGGTVKAGQATASERPAGGAGVAAETGSERGEQALLDRLDEVMEEAGLYVATEIRGGVLYLSGEVDSIENRDAALDLATALAAESGLRVDDSIEIVGQEPEEAFPDSSAQYGSVSGYVDVDADNDGVLDAGFSDAPDFTGSVGTADSEEASAEAVPYFPPTDPVVESVADNEELRIVGGFAATAMDDEAGAAGFADRPDDDITQAVVRELAADALTIDLKRIRVNTIDGIVFLRGEVPTLDDAENAEAVASRVAGVNEVREELAVTALRNRER